MVLYEVCVSGLQSASNVNNAFSLYAQQQGGNLHARARALPPRAVCEDEEAARLAQRRVREDADRFVPGALGPAIRQARLARRCGGVRGLAVRSFRFRPRLVGTGCCQR